MLADDAISEVWAKAQRDETLSPKEKVQVVAVVSELVWASFASFANPMGATSEQREIFPAFVAAEVGPSRILSEIWSEWERELRASTRGSIPGIARSEN